jgi:hypothetical protein
MLDRWEAPGVIAAQLMVTRGAPGNYVPVVFACRGCERNDHGNFDYRGNFVADTHAKVP